MAEPKSRIVVVGKLLVLVGLPLAVIATIFGAGVHWGYESRASILRIEKHWLGMDVQVPVLGDGRLAALIEQAETSWAQAPEASAPALAPLPAEPPPGTGPASDVPPETGPIAGTPTPAPPVRRLVVEQDAPTSVPSGPPVPEVVLDKAYPLAVAPELAPDLAKAYDRTRVLKVKVLVDRAYVEAHPDWLSDVRSLMGAASENFGELFGMHLQLWGVVEWDVAQRGLDIEELHADLKTRHREGADLLLGITGREVDGTRRAGWSETPARRTPRNTAFALVYANDERPDRMLRAVLLEFGHCFGAHDVTDPDAEAWKQGSVMSYANVSSGATPWFDPENMRTILERKHKDIETGAGMREGEETQGGHMGGSGEGAAG